MTYLADAAKKMLEALEERNKHHKGCTRYCACLDYDRALERAEDDFVAQIRARMNQIDREYGR